MTTSLLLKNGTLLIHDEDDHVVPTKADLLITGNNIARIAQDISATDAAEVIDCTNKIVSPGFIDGHQHVWQTQLRGRHVNDTFLEYMVKGNVQSSNYQDEDFFWGQLGGCISLLSAGTTTVLDHAHMTTSPTAVQTAILATVSSGIRSIFAYCPINQVTWTPKFSFATEPGGQMLAPWVLCTFSDLASRSPFGPNGRVTLGLAFDGWFLPQDACMFLFRAARANGIEHLTTHASFTATLPLLEKAQSWGIFPSLPTSDPKISFPHIILSHANDLQQDHLALLAQTQTHVVSTPSTELLMALGPPIAFADANKIACLGGDCHAAAGLSIPGEMRTGLIDSRARHWAPFLAQGKQPKKAGRTVEEAFNLGTIKGARALGWSDRLGRIKEGYLADLVIFDGTSTTMIGAAQEDPVGAVVLHSCPGDVEWVIVDGVVRKRAGRMVDVEVEGAGREVAGRQKISWEDVAKQLMESKERIRVRGWWNEVDWEAAKKVPAGAWGLEEADSV
ncbi:Amidohydrolase-like protein 6 [Elsinoe fawcettii]|nr:Amidohydrolase-like protein 6 [Elsinoe fawcettii]